MPGNLAAATVSPLAVLPWNLCTLFRENRIFPGLDNRYHDGSVQQSLITDTVNPAASIRSWQIATKLSGATALALRGFFEGQDGGFLPFYFYNPFEAAGVIGSNWDATGVSTQGRHTCVFRGNWAETIGLPRTTSPLEIAEID